MRPDSARPGFHDAWQRLAWAWPYWLASPALWLLALIATPVSLWTTGEATFPLLATLGVVAHAFATVTSVAGSWPAARLAAHGALIAGGAWGIEAVGIATGVPFGIYHYTQALQPQLGGVPVVIPLAWFMMLLPAWAMADAILDGHRPSAGASMGNRAGTKAHPRVTWRFRLLHAGLGGLAFTAWDLYLDPQMVARNLWVWDSPDGYFGIPWTNFAGWWVAATLLSLAAGFVRRDHDWRSVTIGASEQGRHAARLRLMIVYTLTWAFQAVGLGLFWGQPGPALAGFAAMGPFVAAGWLKELRLWT